MAFLVGLIVALKLVFPGLLPDIPYLSYGRLRPLHTNAAIFAFAGNAIFVGVYYSLQRLCKARMFSDRLSALHFWGWQFIIVLAALTLPLGITTSKEYAELEWPIDLLITGVWVVFGWNMIGTILRRRERHLYVSIWFYLATFITVALLHVVNSLELPVSLLKSYSMYAGVQDALVQWWYGHNAVAFFLTTPFLGVMYYFIPKAANRPVFSYRLSIVHFWSLIFLYIWAGPHHLLYTALPDWAQTLGTVFSIMLIAPSWGGMVNGLLTLRGAWDRVREDPVLKFMVVGVTAYGMSTFEGPMMSLKNVNAITHYTDYIIAHVHVGALAWNGGLAFAMLYYIVPRIYGTTMYSNRLANVHFWLATLGILFYAIPMYIAGITQSLMWQDFTADGTLRYPNFLETVVRLAPMYALRAIGGTLFLTGGVIAVYNLYRTARQGALIPGEEMQAPAMQQPAGAHRESWHRSLESRPVQFAVLTFVVGRHRRRRRIRAHGAHPVEHPQHRVGQAVYAARDRRTRPVYPRRLRRMPFADGAAAARRDRQVRRLLEAGRVRVRPPVPVGVEANGPGSPPRRRQVSGLLALRAHEAAVGDLAAVDHARLPVDVRRPARAVARRGKIITLRRLGVPYPDGYERQAASDLAAQAAKIADGLKLSGFNTSADREIVALIAYLQRLGTDIKSSPTAERAIASTPKAAVVAGGQ